MKHLLAAVIVVVLCTCVCLERCRVPQAEEAPRPVKISPSYETSSAIRL